MTSKRAAARTDVDPQAVEAVDSAREAVLAARAQVEQWESKLDGARRDLAALDQSAGEQILADPGAGDAIESRLTVLRSTVRAAERALEAAGPKVTTAESRYLAAEAVALEVPLAAARARLVEHHARTRELLAELEEHEGPFVPEVELANLKHAFNVLGDEPRTRKVLKSVVLQQAVRRLEDQVTILREMAAGRDPREWERRHRSNPNIASAVEYPACVTGPDALVPTRAYLDSVNRLRSTVTELEQLLERDLPAEIEEWKDRASRGTEDRESAESAIRRREHRLGELPAELDTARRQLAELEGYAGDQVDVEDEVA